MSRDYRVYLEDMRGCCEKVLRYTEGLTHEGFLSDEKTFDAVVRNLEIIGEAAKNVPQDVRDLYPDVAWVKAAGLRDILIHAYSSVDEEILWDIVRNHVPKLLDQLTRILRTEEAGQDGDLG